MSCNGGSSPRINTLGRMTRADSGPDLRCEMTGGGGGGGSSGGGGTSRMYYSRRCTVTDQNSDGYWWVPGRPGARGVRGPGSLPSPSTLGPGGTVDL